VLAAVFFACTLLLAWMGNSRPQSSGSVLENAAVTAPAPVVDTSTAAQIPGNAPASQPASAPVSAPAAPTK